VSSPMSTLISMTLRRIVGMRRVGIGMTAMTMTQSLRTMVGETTVSAMMGADRAAQDDFGCLKKIMHGTCTGKNCTFNHTEAAMTKTAKDIGGKCTSYLQNGLPTDWPSLTQTTAILSRTQQGSCS
jgi:hypothetical protein